MFSWSPTVFLMPARHMSAHMLSRNSRSSYQLSVATSRVPGHATSSSAGLTLDRRNGKTLSERASIQQLNKAAAAFGLTIPVFERQQIMLIRREPKRSRRSKINLSSNRNTHDDRRGDLSSSSSSSSNKYASSIDKDTGNSDKTHPRTIINHVSLDDESVGDEWLLFEGDSDNDENELLIGDGKGLSAADLARVRANILEACEEFDYYNRIGDTSSYNESDDDVME